MKFRTTLEEVGSPMKIDYNHRLFCLGSCFAENIGEALEKAKFSSHINPLGISYNPISLAENIETIATNRKVDASSLQFSNGFHFDYNYHGSNNTNTSVEYVNRINNKINTAHEFLKSTHLIFISLGTAHVFEHKEYGIVNNCHKMPGKLFGRRLLEIDEIIIALQRIKEQLLKLNPELKIIFTVSPIRHIRDGLVADRLSKSMLNAALSKIINNDNIHYFPSYELMIDDLRDYRFYKEDMIHPNDLAIKYIWDYFCRTYFSEDTMKTLSQVAKINKMLAHNIVNPSSEETTLFKQRISESINKLSDKIPVKQWDFK